MKEIATALQVIEAYEDIAIERGDWKRVMAYKWLHTVTTEDDMDIINVLQYIHYKEK